MTGRPVLSEWLLSVVREIKNIILSIMNLLTLTLNRSIIHGPRLKFPSAFG